jgi:D-amino peptidase
VPVSRGIGPSTLSIAPGLALKEIRAGVTRALQGNRAACRITLPKQFTLEIKYTTPVDAYRASWYPGAKHAADRTVTFQSADYFEILRAIKFMA